MGILGSWPSVGICTRCGPTDRSCDMGAQTEMVTLRQLKLALMTSLVSG